VLVLFVACLGVRPGFSWLYTPAVLLLHLVFTAGVSLALALLAVQVQDLDRVWVILTTVGFYLTPIFYPLSMLTETRQRLLLFNPLLHIIDSFRACLLGGPPPSLAGVCGVLLLGCTLIGLSLSLFRRNPAWIMDRILQP
jgi:lipopolysaccharide transport system permease protein